MSKFTWLHFSDLHFCKDGDTRHHTTRDRLCAFLKSSRLSADFLFITGDIAEKANFIGAKEYIDKLIEASDITRNDPDISRRVFYVAGNHDVHHNLKSRTEVIERLRNNIPNLGRKAFTNEWGIDDSRLSLCHIGLMPYLNLYEKLGLKPYPLGNDGAKKIHQLIELEDANIILLNTSILSNDKNDDGKLFIGEDSLVEIMNTLDGKADDYKKRAIPTIALAHHGFDKLASSEFTYLKELFGDKLDLYLCGHSHEIGVNDRHGPSGGGSGQTFSTREITCAAENASENLSFLHGQYINGKVIIRRYISTDSGFNWDVDENANRRFFPDFMLPRFKQSEHLQIVSSSIQIPTRVLPPDCKVFISGAPGVGKTTIANKLLPFFESDNLEVIEVDFIKDVLREDFDLFSSIITDLAPCNYLMENAQKKIKHQRQIIEPSSYKLEYEKLLEQNDYIFKRLISACNKREEKGVPTILEGVNLSIDIIHDEYKNFPSLLRNIFLIDLFMENKEGHRHRLEHRNIKRNIDNKRAAEYLDDDNFERLRFIDKKYREECKQYRSSNPKSGINVLMIDNTSDDPLETINLIVGFITNQIKKQ